MRVSSCCSVWIKKKQTKKLCSTANQLLGLILLLFDLLTEKHKGWKATKVWGQIQGHWAYRMYISTLEKNWFPPTSITQLTLTPTYLHIQRKIISYICHNKTTAPKMLQEFCWVPWHWKHYKWEYLWAVHVLPIILPPPFSPSSPCLVKKIGRCCHKRAVMHLWCTPGRKMLLFNPSFD